MITYTYLHVYFSVSFVWKYTFSQMEYSAIHKHCHISIIYTCLRKHYPLFFEITMLKNDHWDLIKIVSNKKSDVRTVSHLVQKDKNCCQMASSETSPGKSRLIPDNMSSKPVRSGPPAATETLDRILHVRCRLRPKASRSE